MARLKNYLGLILALVISSVYVIYFVYALMSPKHQILYFSPGKYYLNSVYFLSKQSKNIIYVSNSSIAVLKDKPKENTTITFGKVPAQIIVDDDELVYVSVPQCEFLVTKWPITVAVKMITGKFVKVIGYWTYPAQYPDEDNPLIPEVNIAITWIPNLTLAQKFVFKQFIKTLDRTWRFQIFTLSAVQKDFMKDDLIKDEIENGRVELSIMSEMKYQDWTSSQLSRDYWRGMHGDRILSFQSDVVLCENPSKKDGRLL